MAIKKTDKKPAYEYAINDVQNVREWKDGNITLTLVVNGVYIYGCRIIETKDDWFVSFPSRKGSDGKYYNHVWFPISDENKQLIESAINKALEDK